MHQRAVAVGVADQLKVIPPDLLEATRTGSHEARKAAKAELHKLQKANHKIVSRAEQKRQKQTTLV